MFAKAVLVSCLALVAVAAPDRRPASAYGPPRQQQSYQAPQPQQSYQPAQQQTYEPPQQQQTYQAPQQPTYQAPSRQSYEEPRPSYSNRQNTYQQEDQEGMPFDFAYAVQDEYSGNDFAHNSNSDGKVTTGEYRVLLPDGRTQIVTYTADGYNGFQAEVTYEGEARAYEPQAQASYQQPRNNYQAPQQQQSYQAPQQQQQSYQPPKQQGGYGF